MRFWTRLLLMMTCLVWLVGLTPPEVRACAMSAQGDSCCKVVEIDCQMACCQVPGDMYDASSVPVAGTVFQLPVEPVALRSPVLTPLQAPEQAEPIEVTLTYRPACDAPTKIYLLHRALLI